MKCYENGVPVCGIEIIPLDLQSSVGAENAGFQRFIPRFAI